MHIRNTKPDKNRNDDGDPDKKTPRVFDDSNYKEYGEDRCDYQKYWGTGEFRHNGFDTLSKFRKQTLLESALVRSRAIYCPFRHANC